MFIEEMLSPSWLDEDFLVQVLQSKDGTGKPIQISQWKCHHVVPPGSNYLSLLYRISVEYKVGDDVTCRSCSLIIKTPLESGQVKEFVEEVDGYGKELRVYTDLLPKINKINGFRVAPEAFTCPLFNSLVLEDLREQGYKMVPRLTQLDAEHCKQFFKTLARFHGLSLALHKKDPDLVESVGKHKMFSEDTSDEYKEKEQMFSKFVMSAFLKSVQSLGLDNYAKKIQSRVDSFLPTLSNIFNTPAKLNVFNHGDCWTANILFKYDESGQVTSVKLVDFQMSRFGSFAQDIIYFWWTSANKDVRENSQEEMFEIYRITLNQTLKEVNIDKSLSKEEFDQEMKRFAPYAINVVSCLLPLVMADPDDLVDYNEFTENDYVNMDEKTQDNSPLTKNFRSKYFKAVIPDVLRQLEAFGAFL